MTETGYLNGEEATGRIENGCHVLIIGGGASGVLMAVHLLAQRHRNFRITIIERSSLLGCGIAYSTSDPAHLLNTRVRNMSAFQDDPLHFLKWLQARPEGDTASLEAFVSRAIYGDYLRDLLRPWNNETGTKRLRIIHDDCVRLDDTARGVVAKLANGPALHSDVAVLATGHSRRRIDAPENALLSDPWVETGASNTDGRVVVIGSGLTMVDQVISLLRRGHRGEIVAVSRRGLLPQVHTPGEPAHLPRAEVPLGAAPSRILQWMRERAREAEVRGGSWRDAIDGIRPHVQALWRSLATEERGRFLRHGSAYWDIHRHRMPPLSADRIRVALAAGQLRLVRAAWSSASRDDAGNLNANVVLRGSGKNLAIPCCRILDCRGVLMNPERHQTPLVTYLLRTGQARIDPVRIGLETSADLRLVDANGRPSRHVHVIGPASRSAFWEVTAIPDIREQVAGLAAVLAHEIA